MHNNFIIFNIAWLSINLLLFFGIGIGTAIISLLSRKKENFLHEIIWVIKLTIFPFLVLFLLSRITINQIICLSIQTIEGKIKAKKLK